MKKIISIFMLLLVFSFNAKAQESKKSEVSKEEQIKTRGISDVNNLCELLKINSQLKNDFHTIINMRNESLSMTKDEIQKKEIFDGFSIKFLSALTSDQISILKSNTELYNSLFVYQSK